MNYATLCFKHKRNGRQTFHICYTLFKLAKNCYDTVVVWSRRLTVRTPGFHPGNRSSILRGITKKIRSPSGGRIFFVVHVVNGIPKEFDNKKQGRNVRISERDEDIP